ncbi:mycofactocin-coupled SDR family oxidoreductase [Rhodococcus opacus]|uniref:mycofactocin-coupled SDR family oxidoreductase n=1 Tax=Rhodococcus opacus TaxID=37919 RepID=UPI002473EEB6|nr:mycofactocin-coupled SDR family oxidoreductase [Rhodococcus opacus]MDH6291320.1 SDR family mycofactocin-dependent oxidoreductase [Rhodococcus opacus]
MSGRLEGKVAFITGAARGQGRAHAVRMASEGADILAFDLADHQDGVLYPSATMADLEETQRLVEKEGRRALIRKGDVRNLDDMRAFVDDGIAELGGVDIVVANAGICTPQTWDNITPKAWQETIDVDLTGVWNTVMASAPQMVAAGKGGSIVLTCSLAGKKAVPYMMHYTTAKHGVTGLSKGFAAELGQHRIRVNSIHPGTVNSPMASQEIGEHLTKLNETYPQLAASATPFLPEWNVECEDVAATAAFLASDDARFITAEAISIDAGMQAF